MVADWAVARADQSVDDSVVMTVGYWVATLVEQLVALMVDSSAVEKVGSTAVSMVDL